MKRAASIVTAVVLGVATATSAAGVSGAQIGREPKVAEVAPTSRLITQDQYLNTLKSIFGENLQYPAQFAPVHRIGGLLAIGTGAAVVTGGALDQFDSGARSIAAQVVDSAHRDFLIPCHPASEKAPDDACAGRFLGRVGRLLYRRSLRPAELKAYVAVTHQATEQLHGFYPALASTLAGMLISPDFLYVTQPTEQVHGRAELTGYAKAARLSLLLWDSYPDDDLLTAAEKGALSTKKGLAVQISRMVDSPRLAAGVRNFFEDMLIFENFDTLSKDGTIYPTFTPKVAADAREQTLRTIVAHIVDENADYRDLFTTRKTFITNDLGSIYGVPVNRPEGWVPYEFPKGSPRTGLLTQVSFLAVYAQPGRSSPTRRGRAIREIFLCQKVPNPPPNVDFSKLEDPGKAYKTARDRLAAHRANPVCAGCHRITDPIGLALENFDGAGIYRTTETGTPIDASGQLDSVSFTDVNGLEQALHDNPSTPTCLADRLASYALGREFGNGDKEWLDYLHAKFSESGYRVKELLRVIAASQAFYAVPVHPESVPDTKAAATTPANGQGRKL